MSDGTSNKITARIEWRIEKDAKKRCLIAGSYLSSHHVRAPEAEEVDWSMGMCLRSRSSAVSVWVRGSVSAKSKRLVRAVISTYFIDRRQRRVEVASEQEAEFVDAESSAEVEISVARLERAQHDDGSLTLVAEILFTRPMALDTVHSVVMWRDRLASTLLDSDALSDCCIKVGGVVLRANKCVLAAQSPTLMAMFSSSAKSEEECAEVVSSGEGAVEIQRRRSEQLTTIHVHNFPLDCVRAVLHYCYHGCLLDDDGDGEEGWERGRHREGRDVQIFQLADKCGVVGLKEMMEGRLAKKVTHSNVVQMALLADTHSAPGLKKACIPVVVSESELVLESPEWKQLEKEKPSLAAELLEGVVRALTLG